MKRELTDFERQHGYTPCPFLLGAPSCEAEHEPGDVCNGTHPECAAFDNLHRFGGQVVPGHPVSVLLLASLPDVQVVHEDDDEAPDLPETEGGAGAV